jgi:hypothetical protein
MGILRTNKVSGLETPTAVTGSVSFDGSGDYLTLASSGDFGYSTGDFTWELWFNANSLATGSSSNYIIDHGNDNGGVIQYFNNTLKYFNATAGTSSVLYTTGFGSNLSTNTWYHIAAVRRSRVTYLYLNGVLSTSASDNHNYPAQSLTIGNYGGAGAYYWNGYISNLRILKGTALYTSNFTPPVNELQTIGDTVLLCCNNPDSAGAEATGKTITVNGNAAASTFSPGLTRDFTYGTQFSGVTKFDTQGYFVPPSGTTEQRGRGRGLFAANNIIDYIQIQSQGNAIDFGDMSASAANGSGLGSSTRGVFGGFGSPIINTIEYITFSTTSNSLDFGDLTTNRWGTGSTSNNTRGIFYAGYNPATTLNVTKIDYITIATLGSAAAFGDATTASRTIGGCGSSTRGIFAGGVGGTYQEIEYITLSTLGNSVTFGNLSQARFGAAAASSSTRAIFSGGYQYPGPALTNLIDYVTISTTGNAQDFGDLTRANWSVSGTSNSIRGVVAGGYVAPTNNNTIDYVTIASTGNAQDFGDMTSPKSAYAAFSDSHGGLS